MTCDLGDPSVIDQQINDVRRGLVAFGHFGILCRSWCRMNKRFDSGTRTNANPYGDCLSEKELTGNRQLAEMGRLLMVFIECNIHFTIENPHDSLLWHTDEIQSLRLVEGCSEVVLDQCMFKLRPPEWRAGQDDIRIRKRTRILGTLKGLESLRRVCDGSHIHGEAWGHVRVNGKRVSRATAAGAYPGNLCGSFASLIASHLAVPQ